jgi:hypothetical protein
MNIVYMPFVKKDYIAKAEFTGAEYKEAREKTERVRAEQGYKCELIIRLFYPINRK